jgi:integrase
MATLRKINGRYYAYFYDKNRSPTRKSHPLRVQLKRTAEKELNRLEEAKAEGRFDPWKEDPWVGQQKVTPISVQAAIEKFLGEKEREVRSSTVETYEQQLKAWSMELPAGYQVQDLRPKHIDAFVHDSGIANATQRKRYRHLRVFLNWAEKNRYHEETPIDRVKKPRKEEREIPTLGGGDIDAMLQEIDEHRASTVDAAGRRPNVQWLKDTIVLGMYTGLRRGELAGLRWKDIDLDEKTLSVRNREDSRTKTGDERTVPLRGRALRRLRDMRDRHEEVEPNAPVIADGRGKPVRRNRMTRRFRKFADEAGLDDRVTLHTLRHSFASMLSGEGISLRFVKAVLGHSTITTTERYSHLRLGTLAEALQEAIGD